MAQNGRKQFSCLQADFIQDRLKEDFEYIQELLQQSFGNGKTKRRTLLNITPYADLTPINNADIPYLLKEGAITRKQTEDFHDSLVEYVKGRFDDYCYIPENKQTIGTFSGYIHRGYDILLGIAIFLEVQLGVHLGFPENTAENKLRNDYELMIEDLSRDYKPRFDMDYLYNKHLIPRKVYKRNLDHLRYERKKRETTNQSPYSLMEYYRFLVTAYMNNDPFHYNYARHAFPRGDFVRMLIGMMKAHELFHDESMVTPTLASDESEADRALSKMVLQQLEESDENMESIKTYQGYVRYLYHETVYYLFDEYNVFWVKANGKVLDYNDKVDIRAKEDDCVTSEDGIDVYLNNPANKFVGAKIRNVRMEIIELLQGRFFTITYNGKDIAHYPIIPYFATESERVIYLPPYVNRISDNSVYSESYTDRALRLQMEFRLPDIPPNCVREYLNPRFFFNWRVRKSNIRFLQEQTERIKQQNNDIIQKNGELEERNERIKKQSKIITSLVHDLSHYTKNYLHYSDLEKTGIRLYQADPDDPTLDEIRDSGVYVIQSATLENYLYNQVVNLVDHCTAENDGEISAAFCNSISTVPTGIDMLTMITDVLKFIMSQIIFNPGSSKTDRIRKKYGLDDRQTLLKLYREFVSLIRTGSREEELKWLTTVLTPISINIKYEPWNTVYFIKNGSAYNFISNLLTEMFHNAIVHGNGEPIEIEFDSKKIKKEGSRIVRFFMVIRVINGDNGQGDIYEGEDLSLRRKMESLGKTEKLYSCVRENGRYTAEAFFPKKMLLI